MEVRGKIIVVQPIQTGEGKNGTWKKQENVIEYDRNAQYPRTMMINRFRHRKYPLPIRQTICRSERPRERRQEALLSDVIRPFLFVQ